MALPLKPPGYEEIHRSEFARIFGRVMGARLYAAPALATFALVLVGLEPSAWRRAVLLFLACSAILLSVVEARRYRHQGMAPRAADLNLAAGAFGQLIATATTGGLESPVLPPMLLISLFMGMIMVERPWYYWALIGMQVASVWIFAAIAVTGSVEHFNLQILGGGPRAGHTDLHLWLAATVMTIAVVGATSLGRGLRRVFDSMLWRALSTNEALRKEHAERSRELVGLSGEIAHELKNPLSSVKGLAALLEKDAPAGKTAERLSVLRREIDRMQQVLDEFLNFSRPLSPLALEERDLASLCEEVAALHEGLSRERAVAIELTLASAPVSCDPRKVKQVLINLLQNALDASRAGQSIAIECSGGETGRVRVLDRGAGLDPTIVARLFEPGATTKAKGSGLGLTIARALARQHGGDLTLGAREGGGCVAELTLPRTVAPALEGTP
jgi:signal transduction histidine kinase